MPIVLLVRHGRSTANAAGVLAGRRPGVELDDAGRHQAAGTAERLRSVAVTRVVSSPLKRCLTTASAIDAALHVARGVDVDERLVEPDFGEWEGRAVDELHELPDWQTFHIQPSALQFPSGESVRDVQTRAVSAMRDHDAEVEAEAGATAVWVAVTHADVIKSVLVDAAGSHLDHLQRFWVDPGSVSVVRYTPDRSFVLAVNTHEDRFPYLAGKSEPGLHPAN